MKLSAYLKENGLNASAFAKMINVSPSAITRWIHSERKPNLDLLLRIEAVTKGAVTPKDFASPQPTEA